MVQLGADYLGEDFLQTDSIANTLLKKMRNIEGLHDLRLSRDAYKGQYQVRFDRDKLAQNGLSMSTVSQYIRNRINGMTASIYREDGEEYYIVVRYAPPNSEPRCKILKTYPYTLLQEAIRVRELSSLEESQAPPTAERKTDQRIIKIARKYKRKTLGRNHERNEVHRERHRHTNGNRHKFRRLLRRTARHVLRCPDSGTALQLLLVYIVMALSV